MVKEGHGKQKWFLNEKRVWEERVLKLKSLSSYRQKGGNGYGTPVGILYIGGLLGRKK